MAAPTPIRKQPLAFDNINACVKNVRYAVRGKLVLEALMLEQKIKDAKAKGLPNPLPFDEIIYCNIGNPQQLNQKPITFFRQVLALMEYPPLMDDAAASKLFPKDAIARARRLLDATGCIGGTGAYSHSKGLPIIRQDVCKFILERDGVPCDPEAVFLTDGASTGVKLILNLLIKDSHSGIMTPIPQYPLYSASIAAFGGTLIGYYLDESSTWGLSVKELERSYNEASSKGIDVRCIAVINPSNPTGQLLSRKNMEEIIKFCIDKNLVLMADEVYQENIYPNDLKFISFRKVMFEMGSPYKETLQLISYHSVSKGFIGECGKRGGYMQLENVDQETLAEIYKMSSVGLCPNVVGQVVTDLMVQPPKPGDASYEQYAAERNAILSALKSRAKRIADSLNKLEGYSCQPAAGAMYLFPTVTLPPKAVAEAKKQNEAPDQFYCLAMLHATGICVVPGSGFGQVDGTYHFRTTFLPGEERIENVVTRMDKFHSEFMAKYKD